MRRRAARHRRCAVRQAARRLRRRPDPRSAARSTSPREPPIEAATADDDVHLIPGATIAGGRYRLLVFHGGPPNLQFWQALDTALDRQVALTFVDPDARAARRRAPGDPGPHAAS